MQEDRAGDLAGPKRAKNLSSGGYMYVQVSRGARKGNRIRGPVKDN